MIKLFGPVSFSSLGFKLNFCDGLKKLFDFDSENNFRFFCIRGYRIALCLFILLCVPLFNSCSNTENENDSTADSRMEQRVWYKQHALDVVYKVLFENENHGWAISSGRGEAKGKLEFYDGTLWQEIDTFPYSVYPQLTKYNDSTLWYIIHETNHGDYRPRHFQILNGRRTEIPIPPIMFDATDYVIFKGIAVAEDGTAWMVGQQGNILFFDKKKWRSFESPVQRTEVDSANLFAGDLGGVCVVNKDLGYAVGSDGKILKYENGRWQKMESPTDRELNAVYMIDENAGWAVGNDGAIVKYEDGKWTNYPSPVFTNFKSVKFINPNRGWICGFNGVLLGFDGHGWKQLPLNNQVESSLLDVEYVLNKNGNIDLWLAAVDGIYTTAQSYGFSFSNVTLESSLREEGKCGHFFDANGDAYPDLIVQKDLGPPIFYVNHGGLFEERNLPSISTEPVRAICSGDVNNDGNGDVFLYSAHDDYSLLLGKGNAEFLDFTVPSGITFKPKPPAQVSAKFVDFNNDGNLDLYFSDNHNDDYLFANDGTGRFENKFARSNIQKVPRYNTYGNIFSDFNNDGLIDVFIIYNSPAAGRHGALFLNEGEFKFKEKEIPAVHTSNGRLTRSAIAADMNNDQSVDLIIYNCTANMQLLLNDGQAEFEDVSAKMGFTDTVLYNSPNNGIINSTDINNDGWTDFFAESRLFMNRKGSAFHEVSKYVGLDFLGNPSFSDYDNDGDYDLFIGRSSSEYGKGVRAALFRNNLIDNKSVKIRLYPDKSNRSAIGTKITLYQNDSVKFVQTVGLGSAPMVNNDFSSVLIPVDQTVNRLEVIFPGGETKIVKNIIPGNSLEILESDFLQHHAILALKSLKRTYKLINLRAEIIKLGLFLSVLVILIFIFRRKVKFKYLRHPFFIAGILLAYFLSVHFNILRGFVTYSLISFAAPAFLGMIFILISAEMIERKQSKYIAGYKLLDMVGMGGMGKVYRAQDIHKKRIVALKILNPDLVKSAENKKRLSNEGKILASFDHPAIVKVFEIGETEEHTYVAMEFLSGGTLYDYIRKGDMLNETEVIRLALEICLGLKVIHESYCIHRDLKSHNIMFGADGRIRIMDFGLSKAPLVSTMTTLGTALGTLGYTAPEQITGIDIDHRTDIFSFGVIIFEMLTQSLPFKGDNEMALIHAIFNTEPAAPSTIRGDISKKWDRIVENCLAKDVNNRFAAIDDMMQAIKTLNLK